MRISDWSSDVCSSDLAGRTGTPIDQTAYQTFLREIGYLVDAPAPFAIAPGPVDDEVARIAGPQLVVPILNARFLRSEEHTSELQSLMRISYAVFCLKKKNDTHLYQHPKHR